MFDEVKNHVLDVIAGYIGYDAGDHIYATDFDILGVDSLDRLDIYMNVEDKFKVKIGDRDIEYLNNVKSIVEFVIWFEPKEK